MRAIDFTQAATGPLWNPASGARYVPLADGVGTIHLSCLHLEPGAKIQAPKRRRHGSKRRIGTRPPLMCSLRQKFARFLARSSLYGRN